MVFRNLKIGTYNLKILSLAICKKWKNRQLPICTDESTIAMVCVFLKSFQIGKGNDEKLSAGE